MTGREQEWKQKSQVGISVVQARGHGHLNLGRTGYSEKKVQFHFGSKRDRTSDGFDARCFVLGFPSGSDGKESGCNVGNASWIPGSGRSPREENGNPLQYSCLENPMDGGAWWARVHRVIKSWTQLNNFSFTF